jgi:hypothetical protein
MDLTRAEWRKSSHSAGNEGECVEVATNLPNIVAIRDSKNPNGSILILTPRQWTDFIGEMKAAAGR